MMKKRYTKRRNLFAFMLLMVMMMQMGFKVLHQHHHAQRVEISCSDCNHHRIHSGHILDWSGETDACPLCQLLANPYIPAKCVVAPQPTTQIIVHGITSVPVLTEAKWCPISPRGPPSFLFCNAIV